jgi:hypothetical protein
LRNRRRDSIFKWPEMCCRVFLKTDKAFERLNAGMFQCEPPRSDIANYLNGRDVMILLGPATFCSRGALAGFDSTKYRVTDLAFIEACDHGEHALLAS